MPGGAGGGRPPTRPGRRGAATLRPCGGAVRASRDGILPAALGGATGRIERLTGHLLLSLPAISPAAVRRRGRRAGADVGRVTARVAVRPGGRSVARETVPRPGRLLS